jgi:hypothetical protein
MWKIFKVTPEHLEMLTTMSEIKIILEAGDVAQE